MQNTEKMQHTSGPWTQTDTHIVCAKRSGREVRIAETSFSDSLKKDSKEDAANARLIAAAPDMLNALKMWQAAYAMNDFDLLKKAVELAGKAINKATSNV